MVTYIWVNINSGNVLLPDGAKPLPEAMLGYCQLNSGNKFQWNSNRNSTIFIQENASKIVVCQNGGHFVQGR